MNLNKVFLIGRVASDIELLSTQTGKKVCKISLATNRTWKAQGGEKKEETNFHNIILWEKLAEIVSQYSAKGSILLVEGRIENRSWEDKDKKKRYTTEIIAENIQLGPKSSGSTAPANKAKKQEEVEEELPVIDEDEIDIKDIPF